MSQTARPLSRRESKLVTRHRLMQAALAVLVEEGRSGLTTSSVTKRIGVTQPTFYVHFRDMDELLRELATDIVERLRKTLHEARAPLRESADLAAASREAFRLSVRATVKHADLLRILLAAQYHPHSTLGECAQKLLNALIDDLVADAAGLPVAVGLKDGRVRVFAESITGLIIQMGLALADGRLRDEEEIVNVLAHTAAALAASIVRRPGLAARRGIAKSTRGKMPSKAKSGRRAAKRRRF